MKRKIGILGGTFNPIHLGHVDLGLKVMRHYNLNAIWYILSANPPHKECQDIVAPEIRWSMLKEGLKPWPNLVPCDMELKRNGPSWTIDTIDRLKTENAESQYFFISGSEGFLKVRSWKDYRRLLNTVPFIIVLRNETHRQKVIQLLEEEGVDVSTTNILDTRGGPRGHIFSYQSEKLFLSSTLIRDKIKKRAPIDEWVAEGVEKIIKEHGLYGHQ